MLRLSLQATPDTKLDEACATAVRVSNLVGIPVSFNIRDFFYEARPGMTLESMLAEYGVKDNAPVSEPAPIGDAPTPPTAPAESQPKGAKKGTGKSKPAAEPPAEGKE